MVEKRRLSKDKERKSGTKQPQKRKKSKLAGGFAFPSDQERLPAHIPGTYQVAMGTSEEVADWLRGVSPNTQAVLVIFSNEASYRTCAPIFWHVAHILPEIIARVQRRNFEKLVDALQSDR